MNLIITCCHESHEKNSHDFFSVSVLPRDWSFVATNTDLVSLKTAVESYVLTNFVAQLWYECHFTGKYSIFFSTYSPPSTQEVNKRIKQTHPNLNIARFGPIATSRSI